MAKQPTKKQVQQSLVEAAHWALSHFEAMDRANAQIHCAPVRYSPLTFRLAEALQANGEESLEVQEVMTHRGQYQEDPGRE